MLDFFYYLDKEEIGTFKSSVSIFTTNRLIKGNELLIKEYDVSFFEKLNSIDREELAKMFLLNKKHMETRFKPLTRVSNEEIIKHISHYIDFNIIKKANSVLFGENDYQEQDRYGFPYPINKIEKLRFFYKENYDSEVELPNNVRPFLSPKIILDKIEEINLIKNRSIDETGWNVCFLGEINPYDCKDEIFNLSDTENLKNNGRCQIDSEFNYIASYPCDDNGENFIEYLEQLSRTDIVFLYLYELEDMRNEDILLELQFAKAAGKLVVICCLGKVSNRPSSIKEDFNKGEMQYIFFAKDLKEGWEVFKTRFLNHFSRRENTTRKYPSASHKQINYLSYLYRKYCFSHFSEKQLEELKNMNTIEMNELLSILIAFKENYNAGDIRINSKNNPKVFNK